MRRVAICCGLLLGLCASALYGGYNPEPHTFPSRLTVDRMTMGEAIRRGYVGEHRAWKWDVCYAGGIDTRHGGTKQPVGAGGIRDLRTDLWGGAGSVIVNPYTDATGYGVMLTRVDALGDSISIYRYAYTAAKSGAVNRSIGGTTCGARSSGYVQVACSNYDKLALRGLAADAPDFATGAGTQTLWHIDSTTTQSADSVVLVDKWYWNYPIAANDTCELEVRRRISLHSGEPYIRIRLNVRSTDCNNPQGVAGDSIRFVWADVPSLGQEGIGAVHLQRVNTAACDVGYQNRFGEVRQKHTFDDFADPVGAYINIGNSLAAGDTALGQTLVRNDIADSLWLDQGSGDTQTLGMFIAFNPNGEVPTEIYYGENDAEAVARWAYDTTFIAQHDDPAAFNYDSTDAIGSTTARGLGFRSAVVALDTTDFSVWEYAIGTVRFSDQDTPYWPAIPKITFTDGTVLAIPYYRKR